MPTYLIPTGVPTAILQNVAYALPAKSCHLSFSAALEGAFDIAGPWVANPGTPGAGGAQTSAPFIRCPSGNAIVCAKAVG